MSVIKVEIKMPEAHKAIQAFAENRLLALDSLVSVFRETATDVVNGLLNAEIDMFLGKADQSDNKRNGFRERDYTFKGLGTIRVRMPTDRKRRFSSMVIPSSERIDPRLVEDVAALHLAGLSTRTLSMMARRILGLEICPKSVTNSLDHLTVHAEKWLKRPIDRKFWALIVDGTNFKVRRRDGVEREPSLVVLGIDLDNKRSVLAIESGNRDNVASWRTVFRELKARGLDAEAVHLGIMDGLPGLENLFCDEFPNSKTQRCWFHALQNVLAKTPKRLTETMHAMCLKVMYANSKADAIAAFDALKLTMIPDAKRAVDCLEKDLESLICYYSFDKKLWRALRTSNAVERINKEFKRRTKSMEALGESTLNNVLAFTALRLETAWQRRAVDTYETDHLMPKLAKMSTVLVEHGAELN